MEAPSRNPIIRNALDTWKRPHLSVDSSKEAVVRVGARVGHTHHLPIAGEFERLDTGRAVAEEVLGCSVALDGCGILPASDEVGGAHLETHLAHGLCEEHSGVCREQSHCCRYVLATHAHLRHTQRTTVSGIQRCLHAHCAVGTA